MNKNINKLENIMVKEMTKKLFSYGFIVHLETGKFDIVEGSDSTEIFENFKNINSYEKLYYEIFEATLVRYRERISQILSLEALRNIQQKTGFVGTETFAVNINGTMKWREVTILIAKEENLGSTVFLGIKDRTMEEENRKAQLSSAIYDEVIVAMSQVFFSTYMIDLTNNTFVELKSRVNIHEVIGTMGGAQEQIYVMCDKLIADDSKDSMRKFVDFSTMNERLKDKQVDSIEYQGVTQGWCRAHFFVMRRDEDGHVTHIIYATERIHEEKQRELEAQRQLREALEEAEIAKEEAKYANHAKTAFLNNMSHDIRTPLNVITGMLHIARGNIHNEERLCDCLDKIDRSAEHLMSLVNDVLDVSKLESGRIVLERVSFSPKKVCKDLATISVEMFKEKNISFEFFDEGISYQSVYGAPLAIKRVVLNLLSNALKYTAKGGTVKVSLTKLSCLKDVQIMELRVQDNGIGMSQEFVENHLFKVFSREDADLSSKGVHGSGLGMHITKLLVEKMGGTIRVESKLGVGTTFIVTVPFEIDRSEEKILEETEESISGKHFLVAEDNELNREIIQYMLEAEGATIDFAENGKQAVELFAEHMPGTYDAILMDVNMPVLDGIEAARTIRGLQREDAKSVIILAVTANAFVEDVNKSLAAGMNDHINKPIEPKVLKNKLMQL